MYWLRVRWGDREDPKDLLSWDYPPPAPSSCPLAWCPAAPLNPGQKRVSGRRRGRNSQARMLREPSWTGWVAALSRGGRGQGGVGRGEHSRPSPQDRPPRTHTPPHPAPIQPASFCGREGVSSQMQSPSSMRHLPRAGCYGRNRGSRPSPTDCSSHSQLTNERTPAEGNGQRLMPSAAPSDGPRPCAPPTHGPHRAEAGAPCH